MPLACPDQTTRNESGPASQVVREVAEHVGGGRLRRGLGVARALLLGIVAVRLCLVVGDEAEYVCDLREHLLDELLYIAGTVNDRSLCAINGRAVLDGRAVLGRAVLDGRVLALLGSVLREHGFQLLLQLDDALGLRTQGFVHVLGLRTQGFVHVEHVARDVRKTCTIGRHPAAATPTSEYIDIGQPTRWQLAARVHAVVVARCGLGALAHTVCAVHTAEE